MRTVNSTFGMDVVVVELAPLIVVAFDGTPSSERAAAYAVGVASRQAAALLFVHVWQPAIDCGLFPQVLPWDDDVLTVMRSGFEKVLADLVGPSVHRWEVQLLVGNTRYEIARIVEDLRADGLVVGASGRRRRLTGSLGASLAAGARCPVTVVP
jgi:nucleotide-binding universal stress UspA family protein